MNERSTLQARLLACSYATIHVVRHSEQWRLPRYFVAGVVVSIGYTLTVIVLVDLLRWLQPDTANAVSLTVWTPVSYLVHRNFTFRFDGDSFASLTKYVVVFFAKLLTSILVVILATNVLGAHYLFGVLANWLVLPLIAYVTLKLWVFGKPALKNGGRY